MVLTVTISKLGMTHPHCSDESGFGVENVVKAGSALVAKRGIPASTTDSYLGSADVVSVTTRNDGFEFLSVSFCELDRITPGKVVNSADWALGFFGEEFFDDCFHDILLMSVKNLRNFRLLRFT